MTTREILILLSIFLNCLVCRQSPSDKIDVVDFSSYGFSFETGEIFEVKNKMGIAYYRDYVLYQTTVIQRQYKGTSPDIDIYLNDTTGTKSYRYYVFKKGQEGGLMLNLDNQWKPFKHEDFLKANGLNFANYDFFRLDLGKPDQVQLDPKTNEVEIEKFANKTARDQEPDSLYRYYNKDLVDIEFSFNPDLDQNAKSKLSRIGLVYYSTPKSALKAPDAKRRESFWKIERPKAVDSAALLKLFESFILEQNKASQK